MQQISDLDECIKEVIETETKKDIGSESDKQKDIERNIRNNSKEIKRYLCDLVDGCKNIVDEKDKTKYYEERTRMRVEGSYFIKWNESLNDSYYRKAYKQALLSLYEMGLCCGTCRYSILRENGDVICNNIIHRNTFSDVIVMPDQICELVCVSEHLHKYIFDFSEFKYRTPGKCKDKSERRFPHVGFMFKDELKHLRDEHSNTIRFIDFIQSEIPDVYKKLLEEFKRIGE